MSEGIQWPETHRAGAVSCQPPLTNSWKCVQSVILWYYQTSCTKRQHSHALNRQHVICVAGLGSCQEPLWHKDKVKNIKMIYDSMQLVYLFSGHHSFDLCLGGQRLLNGAALLQMPPAETPGKWTTGSPLADYLLQPTMFMVYRHQTSPNAI